MIIIVGATGYIGRYLSVYLKNKGYDLLALGRSTKVQHFFEENNVPFHYFDVNDERSYAFLPKQNVQAVIYLSACLAEHETSVEEIFAVNTIGVYKLLEYCRINGIKKFVLTSSHKVYNDVRKSVISEKDGISFKGDHSNYIISKIAAEQFVEHYNKDYDIKGIILRLTGVHGYGEILGHLFRDGTYRKSTFEYFFEKILEGEKIEIWGDQSIKRDHIYIKDVLTAIELAINAVDTSGIFNIASGVGYSQYEEALALNTVFGGGEALIELHPEKAGLSKGYIYDISAAKEALGWKPQYTNLVDVYSDYKKEWELKKYHNYHRFKPDCAPKTL